MNPVDDAKRTYAVVLNKSDIAGTNWMNPIFAVIMIVIVGYAAFAYQGSKDWTLVVVLLAAFFGLVIAALVVFGWWSRKMLAEKLAQAGKTPVDYANVSVVFRPINEQDMKFTDLNLHAIDGVCALCDGGDFYYMPWAWYMRTPLMKIGKAEVLGVEGGVQKISRDTVPVMGGNPQTVMATKGVNAAMRMEDRMLPMDKTGVKIRTATGSHEFLFHPKEIKFVEKLLEALKGTGLDA